jgi:hypothetical protein
MNGMWLLRKWELMEKALDGAMRTLLSFIDSVHTFRCLPVLLHHQSHVTSRQIGRWLLTSFMRALGCAVSWFRQLLCPDANTKSLVESSEIATDLG